MTTLIDDSLVMLGRSARRTTRNAEAMITSVVLPVILLLLFVYLFGGAIDSGAPRYIDYVVPGIILLCAGFGSAMTAVSVAEDMTNGIIDRFRSMDVSPTSVLVGHVLTSVARNIGSTLIVVGVAVACGFRSGAGVLAWVAVAGLLVLFMLSLSWLSAAIGVLARTPEGANGFTFGIMFVPYLSSAFVPIDSMPSVLRPIARHQPVTPVIEAVRALLGGRPVGSNGWVAIAWCLGILVVSAFAATVLFRSRTSS